MEPLLLPGNFRVNRLTTSDQARRSSSLSFTNRRLSSNDHGSPLLVEAVSCTSAASVIGLWSPPFADSASISGRWFRGESVIGLGGTETQFDKAPSNSQDRNCSRSPTGKAINWERMLENRDFVWRRIFGLEHRLEIVRSRFVPELGGFVTSASCSFSGRRDCLE